MKRSVFSFGLLLVALVAAGCPATTDANGNPLGLRGDLRNNPAGIQPIVNQIVIMGDEVRELTSLLRTAEGLIPSQPVRWTSSDTAVAFVNPSNNKVVGGKAGSALLTGVATNANGSSSQVTIEVQVIEKHLVKLIQVTPPSPALVVGKTVGLSAQVFLANGEVNSAVTWSSSDNTLASVNASTGEVIPLKPGRVTVVATYALDPRYKAVADVTIVEKAEQLPASPAPSAIVFKPGSSPLPVVAPTPSLLPSRPPSTAVAASPTPQASTATTKPAVQLPSTRYALPKGVEITNHGLQNISAASFIDINTAVLAHGTSVAVTRDGGESWKLFEGVGTNSITAMDWLSPTEGYLAGGNGTILKATLENDSLDIKVLDSGTASGIRDILFISKDHGLAIDSEYMHETFDGGSTWTRIDARGSALSEIHPDGAGGFIVESMHHGATRISGSKASGVMLSDSVRAGNGTGTRTEAGQEGRGFVVGTELLHTSDWTNFTSVGNALRTPTQLIRGRVRQVIPIDADTWICLTESGDCLTRDAGKTWTDPAKTGIWSFKKARAFSENEVWVLSNSSITPKLFRHAL